jgi:alpha-glucosidase
VGQGQARIAAMLLLTLRGTPTLYYGDELGMAGVTIPPDAVQDRWEKNEPGLGLGRDPSRTPFQWDATANAGFTTTRPWLPVDPTYPTSNASALRQEPTSILNLYQKLIALRRRHRAMTEGAFVLVSVEHNVLVYERAWSAERCLVCLNFADCAAPVPNVSIGDAEVLLSTHLDRSGPMSDLVLRPNEGIAMVMH